MESRKDWYECEPTTVRQRPQSAGNATSHHSNGYDIKEDVMESLACLRDNDRTPVQADFEKGGARSVQAEARRRSIRPRTKSL